jgi:uncharacterized protein (TIGR00730 family)
MTLETKSAPNQRPQFSRLAVFCGARAGVNPAFAAAARALGQALLARGLGLVYGGGNIGLMGVIADTVLAGGGEVIGVIPTFLRDREVAHESVTELRLVTTMHERKGLIYDLADGVMVLPGGIGTLDELFETWTWNYLQLHAKPCGLLNVAGYYDPLVAMIERAVTEQFLHLTPHARLLVGEDPVRLLDQLQQAQPQAGRWESPLLVKES